MAESVVTMKPASVRLRRTSPEQAGFTRRRRGRGFTYTDADGHPVDAEHRARITALVIPPAWRDVWISPYPNGHLQAVGTDAAGRRQYLYHERWNETRNAMKHARVLALAKSLPAVREEIDAGLRSTESRAAARWRSLCGSSTSGSSAPAARSTRSPTGATAW